MISLRYEFVMNIAFSPVFIMVFCVVSIPIQRCTTVVLFYDVLNTTMRTGIKALFVTSR